MTLAYIIVSLVGAGLIAAGLIYQLRKEQLKSDPVLIGACYIAGAIILGIGILAPLL